MPVAVVVGAQWGDEGKGKVVDFYAGAADVVVRYQGGSNAGHTVRVGPDEFKFHLLPSGVVRAGVRNVIGNGVVVDPHVLLEEIASLRARGHALNLSVSDRAHVIMPYHRELDGLREAAAKLGRAIGTTRRGIGPAYADKAARVGVRMLDLVDDSRLRARVEEILPERNLLLEHYGGKPLDAEAVIAEYARHGRELAPHVADSVGMLHDAVERGERVLLEGAQGTFLDIDHGTYPFVTSSNTTAGGACAGSGLPPTLVDEVHGVVKAYTTRVGEGPFVTELDRASGAGKHLSEVGHEVGTTTGRSRRVGWLDLVLLRRACRVNGFTAIAVTKLDVLGGLDEVRVCEAYDIDGRIVREPPSDLDALARAAPVYRGFGPFPALKAAEAARAAREGVRALPKPMREYVEFVETVMDVPAVLVGLGPGREATIDRRGSA